MLRIKLQPGNLVTALKRENIGLSTTGLGQTTYNALRDSSSFVSERVLTNLENTCNFSRNYQLKIIELDVTQFNEIKFDDSPSSEPSPDNAMWHLDTETLMKLVKRKFNKIIYNTSVIDWEKISACCSTDSYFILQDILGRDYMIEIFEKFSDLNQESALDVADPKISTAHLLCEIEDIMKNFKDVPRSGKSFKEALNIEASSPRAKLIKLFNALKTFGYELKYNIIRTYNSSADKEPNMCYKDYCEFDLAEYLESNPGPVNIDVDNNYIKKHKRMAESFDTYMTRTIEEETDLLIALVEPNKNYFATYRSSDHHSLLPWKESTHFVRSAGEIKEIINLPPTIPLFTKREKDLFQIKELDFLGGYALKKFNKFLVRSYVFELKNTSSSLNTVKNLEMGELQRDAGRCYHWLSSHYLTNFQSYLGFLLVSLESYLLVKSKDDAASAAYIGSLLLAYGWRDSGVDSVTPENKELLYLEEIKLVPYNAYI